MNIAVAGTGYVGLSISVLLAQHNKVKAVDIIPEKVKLINRKKSPIQDEYIEKYLAEKELDLVATLDAESAYKDADFVVIAAPTNYDSQKNFFDTSAVESVIKLVMQYNPNAIMVIKSTIPVGFTAAVREKYNCKNIIFSPEFLRESKALYDNLYPSRIIVGTDMDNSDIDVVLSYTDPDGELREDDFFNMLNGQALSFDGIKVDINPISVEKSGSLEDYLKYAEAFLDRKEEHIKASAEKLTAQTEKTAIVPLSPLTFGEAKEQNMVDEWRASRKATEACAEQFSKEFGAAYHDRRMPEFLKEMADKYGLERCKIVLASTVQLAEHDGRYYPSIKAEAAKVHIPGTDTEDHARDIRYSYATNCHPVMINSAFRELQKMERECGQEKEPAKAEQDCKAPRASVLSRLQEKRKIVNEAKTNPAKNEDRKRGAEL